MALIEVPVIGIGAGPATDGQVLVFHDLLGIRDGLGPRFVKRYANLQQEMNDGVLAFAEDVRSRRYPGPEHTYSIDPASWRSCARTARALGRLSAAGRPTAAARRRARRTRSRRPAGARGDFGHGSARCPTPTWAASATSSGIDSSALTCSSAGTSSVVIDAPSSSPRKASSRFWTNG